MREGRAGIRWSRKVSQKSLIGEERTTLRSGGSEFSALVKQVLRPEDWEKRPMCLNREQRAVLSGQFEERSKKTR